MSINQIQKKEKQFWDSAWSSQKLTEDTEMIDRDIPKTSLDYSYFLLGDIKNKKLLEIGCGSGYQTVEFCQKGAFVTAIDLSKESVNRARDRCNQNRIEKVHILCMNAESLEFKDNLFDRIYINKVLLHTNKEKVLEECRRVLKKDGIIVINEMLKHWVFAFPYRTFSPYRKSKPNYLTVREIRRLAEEHKEFYLLSTFFLFLFYIGINKKVAFTIFHRVAKMDNSLLMLFPVLRNFAWITVASMKKTKE